MVRQYIGRQVNSYFSHRMSTFHHGLVLFALGIALIPIIFVFYAAQLGAVVFLNELVKFLSDSWVVYGIAGALSLGFAMYVLVRGVYEVLMFVLGACFGRFSLRSKFAMSVTFVIDVLLSDFLISAGLMVLSYTYVFTGINRRFSVFWLLLVSFALIWAGVFFQVSFVSAYSNSKNFRKVVDGAKMFVGNNPVEVTIK